MIDKDEQETHVTYSRADNFLHIYTTNPLHLRRLLKEDRAMRLDERSGDDYGTFRVAVADYDPLRGFKNRRPTLSDDERARRAEVGRQNVSAAQAARRKSA